MNSPPSAPPFAPSFILASHSPRRREILTGIGVACQVRVSNIDESVRENEPPADYVLRLAAAKAQTIADQLSEAERAQCWILAADTSVALGEAILGKPQHAAEATAMLSALSDQTHQVYTGVALWHQGRIQTALSVSHVTFCALSAAEIDHYVKTGEPMDKAGAYGIQGRASLFIRHLSGSYSGVMGLPVFETGALLRAAAYPLWPA